MSWTVYTSWQANGTVSAAETCETRTDWPTARRHALSLTCCRGVRYVSLQGPGDVVVGEYDRYTNRWREYIRALAATKALTEEGRTDGH